MSNEIAVELVIALVGAAFNGAVTWGVVSTTLRWIRADLTRHEEWLKALSGKAAG